MEELTSTLLSEVAPLLTTAVVLLVGIISSFLGMQAKKVLNKIETREEMSTVREALENNKEIVKMSVDYVEQIGKHLKAKEKFELAKDKAVQIANEKGITITEQEMEVLIEQAVIGFKEGFSGKDEVVEASLDDKEFEKGALDVEGDVIQEEQPKSAIEPESYDIEEYDKDTK